MTAAPNNWAETSLGDVCEFIRGIAFPSSEKRFDPDDGLIACLRTKNVQKEVDWSDLWFIPIAYLKDDRQNIRVGDILISSANSYDLVGKVALVRAIRHPSTFGAFIGVVRAIEGMDSSYLYFRINAADYQYLIRGTASQTTNISNISTSRMMALPFQVPPLNEQHRIVAKLDALFEKSRSIREKLDRAPRLLANLQKSILNSILNGQDADNWEEVSLIDLCESDRSLTYGIIKLGDHKEDGIPVLRSSNVRHLALELDGMKRVSPSLSDEYSRTILQGSEVVITVRGTLGGVAAVSHEHVGWNVSREVAVIPLKKSINPEFVALAIASPKSQAWLRGTYKGVAYTGINIADLKLLRIRLPQRSQQDEIVQRFNAALSALQNIGAGIESGINRIEALHASMLSKAFRGELVPQDPNDEPASVLLERIRAQEPQAKPERRGRKLTAV